MNFTFVIQQVGVLGIVMFFGFVIVKTGYVDAKFKDAISGLIVKLILPCLIISSISSKEINSDFLGDIFTVLVLSLFCIGILFFIGVITAKIFKIPDGTNVVHKLLCSLGNIMFIGYPIVISMYGEESFFYIMIYWILNDLFLWTIGIFMLSENGNGPKEAPIKKLLNPNTISFSIALIMLVAGIKLPPIVDSAVENVGNLTTYLSMIFIGMALATVDVKKVMKKWWVFIICVVKLVVMPVIFILLFKFLGIKEMILGVVVLESAMPAQTVLSILVNEHNKDSEYATVGMFVTTILSLVTLPFVCYLLEVIV